MYRNHGQRLLASGLMLLLLGQQVPLVISLPESPVFFACHHQEAAAAPGIVACPHHAHHTQTGVTVQVAGLGEIAFLVCNCHHDAPAQVFSMVVDRWVLPAGCAIACPEGRAPERLTRSEIVCPLRLTVDIFHPPRLVGQTVA